MAGELAGKVAIVTGGARGLGRGMVELFVEEGARVVVADVREDEGTSLARELGDAVRFRPTDVSNRDAVQALVDFAVAEFGTLDVICNNAGLTDQSHGRLIDADFAGFDTLMHVNVLGVMLGTQIAARQMATTGGGSIINVSSIGGIHAGFGFFTYRASKAAVAFFSKTAAIELAEHNVRVNVICPGNVPTEMGTFATAPGEAADKAQRIKRAVADARMEWQPLKRQATARDIAEAALYFAGDRSLQVTAQVLAVDGGASAGDPKSQIAAILAARAEAEAVES